MKKINNLVAVTVQTVMMVAFITFLSLAARAATQIDITGPPGSGAFGSSVTTLPNGNIVVVDSDYDSATVSNIGAVYLYNGATGGLISVLAGDQINDRTGSFGVKVLPNGNYIVLSPSWHRNAGAVTFCDKTSGCSGLISLSNSLVGSLDSDQVGYYGVTVLANGNYVVSSPFWSGQRGAVTWGSATAGISGVVSVANSLTGASSSDRVGTGINGGNGVSILRNGNYVVISSSWSSNRGAATFCIGTTGCSGTISSSNSLIGSQTTDSVGIGGIKELTNGNYVVGSFLWGNGAASRVGAVTWGSGTSGVTGEVSSSNSLVGSVPDDQVGNGGGAVVPLSNGNYVVLSSRAATFGNGTTGTIGVISAANSLVGTFGDDFYLSQVVALTNGNYVVVTPRWDFNAATPNAGAVTLGNGVSGTIGVISQSNSLVGNVVNNSIGGNGVTVLSNGNYVVRSSFWNSSSGAVTFGNGITGVVGIVSASNSLVGAASGDRVGEDGVIALSNGNYVVSSSDWDNGTIFNAGAVTFGNGTSGISGVVSPANSLVGNHTSDEVGSDSVSALPNGNFVVRSPRWNGNSGAATFGNGETGIIGEVNANNSLVGNNANDNVCLTMNLLTNGNYVVVSQEWNERRGAVTFGNASTGVNGFVSSANSLVGGSPNDRVGASNSLSGILALTDGNYVVGSQNWSGGRGAATFGNGNIGVTGEISSLNSLIGNIAGDAVGSNIIAFASGNYAIFSPNWDNASLINAGAVSFGKANVLLNGVISADNSVRGTIANSGTTLVLAYDGSNEQIVVGRRSSNTVSLFNYRNRRTAFDFDGDGKADVSVFRPSNGVWFLQQSTAGFAGAAFGQSGDLITPADFDGDGKTDYAVFRAGTWYIQRSQLGFYGVAFGASDDIPVPADYDGDGKTDVAVFRPSNGTWYVQGSTVGFVGIQFGQNGDKPVAADYDGDGKADIAVNRSGTWYINRSQLGFYGVQFGDSNDKLVPADYDGDGKTDIAVFRPSNGVWYLLQSTAGFTGIAFGFGTDIPVAADYDGDGKADVAVVRNGNWYLNRSTQGFIGIQFGTATDLPLPNVFVR